jgi:hypothetical protein
LGEVSLEEVKIDFGVIDPTGIINGLLGLDLLMKLGAVIDLKRLSLKIRCIAKEDNFYLTPINSPLVQRGGLT